VQRSQAASARTISTYLVLRLPVLRSMCIPLLGMTLPGAGEAQRVSLASIFMSTIEAQSSLFERDKPASSDDQMVKQFDTQEFARFDCHASHRHVLSIYMENRFDMDIRRT